MAVCDAPSEWPERLAGEVAACLSASERWSLGGGTRIWLADTAGLVSPLDMILGALSRDEAARAARLIDPAGQRSFAASRLLLRGLLQTSPGDMPGTVSWSRSGSQIALATSSRAPIGLDLERIKPRNGLALLSIVGSRAECNGVAGLTEPERTRRFYRIWTGKEAILKGAGTGFRAPARSVCLWQASGAAVACPQPVTALDKIWQMTWLDQGGSVIALASDDGSGRPGMNASGRGERAAG